MIILSKTFFIVYFSTLMKTSRRELLEWMKSLDIQINKIEELGQGTAICQLLSIMHPSSSLSYIKNPSSEYEYLKNLKVAQNFFYLNSVEVKFPISKLVECKLQDNLEMAQWLYKYYVKCTKNKRNVLEKSTTVISELVNTTSKDTTSKSPTNKDTSNKSPTNRDTELREKNRKDIIENIKKHYEEINMKVEDKCNQLIEDNKKLNEQIKLKEEEINILKDKLGVFADNEVQVLIKDLEENRDFYFLILVEIEKYLTGCTNLDEGVRDDIFNILYKKQ